MSALRRSIAVALAAAALLAGAVATNAQPVDRYAIEFRARSGGIFGHTYVAYGRIDRLGRLSETRYAGFYPSGALTDTPLLAVLAAPSEVDLNPRDRTIRSDLVYRREIDARTYARMPSEIRSLRRSRPLWHLMLYNCNSFAGDVAESLGMQVPSTLEMPKDFVGGLYQLNRRTAPGVAYAAAGARAATADALFWRVVRDEPPPR